MLLGQRVVEFDENFRFLEKILHLMGLVHMTEIGKSEAYHQRKFWVHKTFQEFQCYNVWNATRSYSALLVSFWTMYERGRKTQ